MKLKLIVMTSFLAIFTIFVTLLSGNSEQINNVKNQEIPEVINTEGNTPDKVAQPKVKEEPIVVPETKTEEKKQKEKDIEEVIYTFNYSEESVKNRTYKVRDDGFAPIYNEPFSEKNFDIEAFHGIVAGSYIIDFNPAKFNNKEKFKSYLENNLSASVHITDFTSKEYYDWGFATVNIKLNIYNAEENEEMKELIIQLPEVIDCKPLKLTLPEYKEDPAYLKFESKIFIGQ